MLSGFSPSTITDSAVIEEPQQIEKPIKVETFEEMVKRVSDEQGVDYNIVMGVIRTESGFNPEAVGDGGNSIGLMQIQERFHSDRMKRLGVTDLTKSEDNVRVGANILKEMIDKGNGIVWALNAYNGGEGYAYKVGETEYTRRVMEEK